MLFTLQKFIWFAILPPSNVFILVIAGFVLMKKRQFLGRSLVVLGLVLLYALSLPHIADMIVKPLERGFPPLANSAGMTADAVVVPGAGSTDLEWLGAEPQPGAESLSRIVTGAEISRTLKIPLVILGGNGESFATRLADADTMAPAAYRLGLPKEQVIVERESRNTLENSHAARKLIKGNRIILATSAYYMIRAKRMFEQRGFTVIPAPTYYLGQSRITSFASFIPKATDLAHSSTGLAEWASLAWWKLRGEI